MKIFSGLASGAPPNRGQAWACLLINAFACPGLGSIMAKRRGGWLQLLLALVGAVWVTVVPAHFFATYIRDMRFPPDWWADVVCYGAGGLCLFLAGWLWSVGASLALLIKVWHSGAPPPFIAPPGETPPKPEFDDDSFPSI
jgi:hypothetical protein